MQRAPNRDPQAGRVDANAVAGKELMRKAGGATPGATENPESAHTQLPAGKSIAQKDGARPEGLETSAGGEATASAPRGETLHAQALDPSRATALNTPPNAGSTPAEPGDGAHNARLLSTTGNEATRTAQPGAGGRLSLSRRRRG